MIIYKFNELRVFQSSVLSFILFYCNCPPPPHIHFHSTIILLQHCQFCTNSCYAGFFKASSALICSYYCSSVHEPGDEGHSPRFFWADKLFEVKVNQKSPKPLGFNLFLLKLKKFLFEFLTKIKSSILKKKSFLFICCFLSLSCFFFYYYFRKKRQRKRERERKQYILYTNVFKLHGRCTFSVYEKLFDIHF